MNNISFTFTETGAEPVALTDAKDYLRIDTTNTSDDSLVTALITSARTKAEKLINKSIIQKTVLMTMDYLPSMNSYMDMRYGNPILTPSGFRLKYGPIQSVTSIETTDDTNTTTLWSSSNYLVDISGQRIAYATQAVFPISYQVINGVQVTYVAGYGDVNALGIPGGIVQAVRHLVAHSYENRETADAIPPIVCELLTPFMEVHI